MAYGDSPVAPIPDPLPQNQQTKILTADDKWSYDYARRVVRSDFAYAEAYRTHAHDWRYRNASELYLAWAGQRYWDGTRVPRSSLGIYVVFEQVESMLPKIVAAITDPEAYEFYAQRSDQADHALAWKRLVLGQLSEIGFREHIRRALKSSLVYGNGILETGFEDYYNETVQFSRSHTVGRMLTFPHPLLGNIPIPTDTQENYSRATHKDKKKRPYLRYTSLIDSYVDPNCEGTTLQDPTCGYYIKRVYMRAEQLKALKSNKDFDIPDDATLAQYSKAKTTANQDVTKLSAELFRYNMWNPAMDYSGDPSQKRIEVIEYTTKDRKVWLLNREHPAYNKPNRYGKINFWSFSYADVLDRWHSLAISDVAEGEQRLQQSIINARVDELALSIHRPMVKRRGVTIPAYQLKVRPGVVIETETPDGDIKQLEVQNITQQAFVEVAASESRVQGITGVTDVAATGAPSSGNSANRTATGVNTQSSATQDRMRYYIENAESTVIEPILNEWILLDKKFLDVKEAAHWLKTDPDFKNLDPLDVMNCVVYAECMGSTKIAARMGFLQILPNLAQTWLNPEMLQLLAQQQKKTIDAEEFMRMSMDAINYSPRNPLIVDLSPQQIQAMQQPPPAERLKGQIAMQQDQTNRDIHNKQNITKFLTQFLKEAFKAHGNMAQLDDDHAHFLIEQAMAAHQNQQQNQLTAAGQQQDSESDSEAA